MEQRRPVRRTPINQTKKIKQWSSVWGKGILIWILIFFILIIWIIFFFFFYLIKNPGIWKSLGLSISSIKSITSVFAWIFFWTFFFLFLILWLSYLFKLATKPTGKFKNLIWTIIIFILGLINLWFGFYVFRSIYNIKTDTWPATNEVLIANATFYKNNKEEKIPLFTNNFPLIWPIKIQFQLNKKIFNQVYLPQIIRNEWWNIRPVKFILDCWNWQKIKYTSYDFSPYKYCLYLKKGNYTAKLNFYYLNPNWNSKKISLPEKTIELVSNINFKTPIKLNDEKNEIIWWEVWDKIILDITNIPLDLQLEKNDILIDFLGNWEFKPYKRFASFVYKTDWLYNIKFKIPDTPYPTYSFPLRILPSTKPTCDIQYKNNNETYIISTNAKSPNGPIVKYYYSVINMNTSDTIARGTKNHFKVNLKDGNNYQVKYIIVDSKGKKWRCSTIIDLSDKVNYNFQIQIKNKHKQITTWANNIIIPVRKLPSEFYIYIKNIKPSSYTNVWFDIDNDNQIDEKWNSLKIKITKKEDKTINAIVKDQYWNKTIKKIYFKIDLKPLIPILKVDKNSWSAPLTIKFDASSSYTTKENDKIILFNWDFGDWEKIENTRQWVISHTYKNPWKYFPKVTIETQLWFTWTASKKIIVFRPINSATIVFPDNLWWQIQVENPLKIQLNSDWLIKSINWDFWDWTTFKCSWRECSTIIHTYHKTWLFTITAKVDYLDGSPSTQAIAKINVIK